MYKQLESGLWECHYDGKVFRQAWVKIADGIMQLQWIEIKITT